MRFSYLKEFIELAYDLNFSKAARYLGVSQSTLSKHVIALESYCGAELLDRNSAQVRLTPEGRILVEEAFAIIEAYDHMLQRISRLKEEDGPIVVGGLYLNPTMLDLTSASKKRLKDQGVPVLSYSNVCDRPYWDMVEQGAMDVAFSIFDPETALPSGVSALHLFDEPLVAVLNPGHPLARKSVLSIKDLDRQKMLAPTGSYFIAGSDLARKIFMRNDVRPVYEPVFLQSAQDFPVIEIDNGILVVEESVCRQHSLFERFCMLRFEEEDVRFPFYALHKEKPRNGAVRQFLEALREEAGKLG